MFLAPDGADEIAEAVGGVVGEPLLIGERDYGVFIWGEAGVWDLGEIVADGFALAGENQAGLV